MVQLALSVLIDQCCVFLLHLRIVLLQAFQVIDHERGLASDREHLNVLNVLRDVRGELGLDRILSLHCD